MNLMRNSRSVSGRRDEDPRIAVQLRQVPQEADDSNGRSCQLTNAAGSVVSRDSERYIRSQSSLDQRKHFFEKPDQRIAVGRVLLMNGADEKKSFPVFKRALNGRRQEHVSEDVHALYTMRLEGSFFRIGNRNHTIG